MSLNKSATRRLSLLAGSSLVAAGLAFTSAAVAPTAAHAYDECVPANPPTTLTDGVDGVSDPTLNGATADNFSCSLTTYATGITYTPAGALTVTKTNTTVTTLTANGVNLTGAGGASAITWDSAAGGVTGGAGTAGPVIHVTSGSGPISITTAAVTGTQAGTTHAIHAVSDGGGNITITRATGNVTNNVAGGLAAIAATSNGGNISISNAGGTTTGRLRGVIAQTSGAGSVTLSLGGTINVSAVDGVAAIDAAAGTGGLSITLAAGTLNGGAGKAIIGTSGGAAVLNNTGGLVGGASFGIPTTGGAVDFSGVTGGGVTFTNAGATGATGVWLISGASVFTAAADTVNFNGVGQNLTTNGASINFGAGNDTVNVASFFNIGGLTGAASLAFGTGTDTMNVSGVFSPGNEGLITGLEAFNLSGLIYLGPIGTSSQNPTVAWTASDGLADDVLRINGATFTGSGAARIVMDVHVDATEQAGCATLSGTADCLDVRDGSTAGVTVLTVNNIAPGPLQGGYSTVGITLVDVAGAGTSGVGHFVLDPNSSSYLIDPLLGAVVDRPGLFRYALRYDAVNKRHALVGLPRSELLEYAILGSAAQSIWHMTSEAVTDRQSDLRTGTEPSMWVRASGDFTRRNTSTTFETFGDTFGLDTSHKLYAGTLMGGVDLLTGHGGGYDYVIGGQVGYVGSSFEMDNSPTTGRFTGASGGAYASVWSSRFFVDGTLNGNFLTLDYSAPGLGSKTNTYLNSFGVKVEGGMRAMLGERTFAEPLATLAFVNTRFEEISLDGGEITPADSKSMRAALGLRLGAELRGEVVNVSWFVAGRAWSELEGENAVAVSNPGADLPLLDDVSGGFGEVEAGLSLYNAAGTLSGFLATGVKFKDGYDAVNLSAGVRMAW